jgi:hypothetical protein
MSGGPREHRVEVWWWQFQNKFIFLLGATTMPAVEQVLYLTQLLQYIKKKKFILYFPFT